MPIAWPLCGGLWLTMALVIAPILIGLIGVILPAFGYFPALGSAQLSLDALHGFLARPGAVTGIGLALFIGLMASFLSLLFVFVMLSAGTKDGHDSWLLRWHRRLMGPLIALPHSTVAIAMLFLLAPSGWLVRLASPELTGLTRPPSFGFVPDQSGWLLITGLMLKEIPFLLFIALAQSARLPVIRTQKLGQSFGYHPIIVWVFILWPQIYRQMRLPMLAVLAYSLSVVDMTLILGPTLPPPLAVLVLQGFHDAELTARLAASAGALLQMGVIGAGLMIWLIGEQIAGRLIRVALAFGVRLSRLPMIITGLFASISMVFALLCLGLLSIGLWAFANRWPFAHKVPSDFGLRYWHKEAAFGSYVTDTLLIAVIASIICLSLAAFWLELLPKRSRLIGWLTWLLFIPLFVPQISLLFGLQVALSATYLDGKMATVIFVHCLYILPYIWLVLAPAYQAHDGRYLQVAQTMGMSRLKAFYKVRWGMLGHSFGSAFILGVAVSVALYLPTIFAGAGHITTVTSEAVTLAASGARGPAAQSAFMQMLLPLLVFVFIRAWLYVRYARFADMKAIS